MPDKAPSADAGSFDQSLRRVFDPNFASGSLAFYRRQSSIVQLGHVLPIAIVGIAGSVRLTVGRDEYRTLEAPFALGDWTVDAHRRARVSVTAEDSVGAILVNWDEFGTLANEDGPFASLVARSALVADSALIDLSETSGERNRERAGQTDDGLA